MGTLGKPLAIVLGGRPPPVVRCLNTEPQPQVVTSDSSLARRFYQFCLFFLHFRQKSRKLAFYCYHFKSPQPKVFWLIFLNFPICRRPAIRNSWIWPKIEIVGPKSANCDSCPTRAVIEKLRLVWNDTSCDNRGGTFVATNNVKGDSEKLSVGATDDHGGQGRVFLNQFINSWICCIFLDIGYCRDIYPSRRHNLEIITSNVSVAPLISVATFVFHNFQDLKKSTMFNSPPKNSGYIKHRT